MRFMFNSKIILISAILALSGCATPPHEIAWKTPFDFQDYGIKLTLKYQWEFLGSRNQACSSDVLVENYGQKSYKSITFSVKMHNKEKQLIATDTIYVGSGLEPGTSVHMKPSTSRPLDKPGNEYYLRCPELTGDVTVNIRAF